MHATLMAVAFRLSRYAAWAGGGMILFAALMVSIDVLCRRLLGVTMSGSDEVSGYLFAISTALAFPYALMLRANVRIDALYTHLSARLRAVLDLFGISLLAIFAAFVTWRAALTVQVTWENGSRAITPLQTPLILPQSVWLAGWVLFCLCLALVIWGMAAALMRGDLARARTLGGVLSVEEEIEEETVGVIPHRTMKEG